LDLSLCRLFSDDMLIKLSKSCTQLQALELYSDKMFSDEGVSGLASNCPNLTRLNLYGLHRITDRSLSLFGTHLPKLESVDCSHTRIGSDGLHSLSMCSLVTLSLNGCTLTTNQGLASVLSKCLFLQKLSVNSCCLLTDEIMGCIAAHCAYILHISILDCGGITGNGILQVGKCCKTLMTLKVSSGTAFTTTQIKSLKQLLPQMHLRL